MEGNINATGEGMVNGAGAENTGAATGADNHGGQTPEKTYTQADFDKALQSETDKRVTSALETAKAKWQSEYEAKLKTEKDEAARLAKMTAEERSKAEFQKRVSEFEEREAKYNAERLEFECTKQLAAESLPVEFASMLTGKDADATKQNIDSFKTAFNKAIEAAVTERLKGSAPRIGTAQDHTEQDPFLKGFEF